MNRILPILPPSHHGWGIKRLEAGKSNMDNQALLNYLNRNSELSERKMQEMREDLRILYERIYASQEIQPMMHEELSRALEQMESDRERLRQVTLETERMLSGREELSRALEQMESDRERLRQVTLETERMLSGREELSRALEQMESDRERLRQVTLETERMLSGRDRTKQKIEVASQPHQVQATPHLEKDIEQPKIVVRQSRPIPIPDEEKIVVRVSRPIRLGKAVSSDSYSR